MPLGPGKTTAGLGGSQPQINRTGTTRLKQKQLMISHRDIALMMDYTFKGGYGVLEAGTLMCEMYDAANAADDILVPYAVAADDAGWAATNPAISILTADTSSANIEMATVDAHKFEVGDEIVLAETDGPTYAAVTILTKVPNGDRTAFTTDAFTATNFTVAKDAHVYVKGDTDSGGNAWFCKAIAVLDMDLDTGTDEAAGALGNVIVSNCILRKAAMMAYDAQALTDLGATVKYNRIIIK